MQRAMISFSMREHKDWRDIFPDGIGGVRIGLIHKKTAKNNKPSSGKETYGGTSLPRERRVRSYLFFEDTEPYPNSFCKPESENTDVAIRVAICRDTLT